MRKHSACVTGSAHGARQLPAGLSMCGRPGAMIDCCMGCPMGAPACMAACCWYSVGGCDTTSSSKGSKEPCCCCCWQRDAMAYAVPFSPQVSRALLWRALPAKTSQAGKR